MYSYKQMYEDKIFICDPDGDVIATVSCIEDAEALISHLNR